MNAELTNALVAQNNALAAAIEKAEDAEELGRADKAVTFVADVWTAVGYGYKLVELRQRVKNRAKALASNARNHIEQNDIGLFTVHAFDQLQALETMC